MKKLYLLISLVMLFSFNVIAYENFDECGLAIQEIKKNHSKYSLDEAYLSEINKLYFQKKYYNQDGEWLFERSMNNNLLVESVIQDSDNSDFHLKPMTEVTRIDGTVVSVLKDEEIIKLLDSNSKKKKILIEYQENKNQKRSLVLNRKTLTPLIELSPSIGAISKIDSNSSSYVANLKIQVIWFDGNLKKIFKTIYEKIKNTKEFAALKKQDTGSFVCDFNQKQWDDLNIWTPQLNHINLASADYVLTDKKYHIEFYDEMYPEEVTDFAKSELILYTTDHKIARYSGDFNYKTFPIDKQILNFKFNVTSSTVYGYPFFNEFFSFSSNYFNLKFSDWKTSDAPDYRYYEYEDPLFYGLSYVLELQLPIERNYEYYFLKIFLPIIIILLVAWSCFWVSPKELEARLTVSIVCLLSLIAYTLIIDRDIPKLTYLTIMDSAVLLSYAFSTIPTFESIYVKRVASKNLIKAKRIDQWFLAASPVVYISILIIIFYSHIYNSKNVIQALSF